MLADRVGYPGEELTLTEKLKLSEVRNQPGRNLANTERVRMSSL